MESRCSPPRSQAASAALLLLLSLLATLGFASSSRLVGSLSPGAVLLDPAADPRVETLYQDCATSAPLATVPAAARPLEIIWIPVVYEGVSPTWDPHAAEALLAAQYPVSYVTARTVPPVVYSTDIGRRLEDSGGWQDLALYTRAVFGYYQRSSDEVGVGVVAAPAGIQGAAVLYHRACVVAAGPMLPRVLLHEAGHAIAGLGHWTCLLADGCYPVMSTCSPACMRVGDEEFRSLWRFLFLPETGPRAGQVVTCGFENKHLNAGRSVP